MDGFDVNSRFLQPSLFYTSFTGILRIFKRILLSSFCFYVIRSSSVIVRCAHNSGFKASLETIQCKMASVNNLRWWWIEINLTDKSSPASTFWPSALADYAQGCSSILIPWCRTHFEFANLVLHRKHFQTAKLNAKVSSNKRCMQKQAYMFFGIYLV